MRQLAGTKTRYRRAHAAPLAGLIFARAEYHWFGSGAGGRGKFLSLNEWSPQLSRLTQSD